MSNEKKIVNISVRNLRATGDGTVIVCDNSDYVLHFDFDSEWDDKKAKTARINYNGTKCIEIPFLGNKAEIERTPVARQLQIGVYADNIKTTTPAIFNCDFSILSSNPIHEEIPEDTYNKIMELINEVDDAIVDVSILPAHDIRNNTFYRSGGKIYYRYNNKWIEIGGANVGASTGIQIKIDEVTNEWCVSYDNGESWVSLGIQATGITPHIGENGNWWIGETDTNVLARGTNGYTPLLKIEDNLWYVSTDDGVKWESLGVNATPKIGINDKKNWCVSYDDGNTWADLEFSAIGEAGKTPKFKVENGTLYSSYDNGVTWGEVGYVKGKDGDTPTIENGYWHIGENNTQVKAKGEDGKTPYIQNKYWYINGQSTGVIAEGTDGDTPEIGTNGNWWIGGNDTNVPAISRNIAYVFSTEDELFNKLKDSTFTANLKTGDPFFITDVNVPDYWWDAETEKAYPLETQKVDLSEYPKLSPRKNNSSQWVLPNIFVGETATTYETSDGTPTIGSNGNWYIGETDTEIKAKQNASDNFVATMQKADESKQKTDYTYSSTEMTTLENYSRVYVESSDGNIDTRYYIDKNAQTYVFSPYGYYSLDTMIAAENLSSDIELIKGVHYIEVEHTKTGYTPWYSYHPRLKSVVVRTVEGTVRTDTPRDGTDAVNLQFIRDMFGSETEFELNANTEKVTIPKREADGEMRCLVSDEIENGQNKYDSTACVNKGYVNNKFATQASLKVTNDNAPTDDSGRVKVVQGVGGLTNGEDITDKTIQSLFIKMLTNYEKFRFNLFTTSESAVTYETGTTVTVTKATPWFASGTNPIAWIAIGTKDDGVGDLYYAQTTNPSANAYVEKIESGVEINLAKSHTLTTNGSIYCTLSDGTTAVSKSATFSFDQYNYVAFTNTSEIEYSASTEGVESIGASKTINKDAATTYVWFIMKGNHGKGAKIYCGDEALNTVAMNNNETITFTTKTGQELSYYVYRADKSNISGSKNYSISSGSSSNPAPEVKPEETLGKPDGNYVVFTTNSEAPTATTGDTIVSFANIGDSTEYAITASKRCYVWFLMQDEKNNIMYQKLGESKYAYDGAVNAGKVVFTTASGAKAEYYAYSAGSIRKGASLTLGMTDKI